MLRAFTINVTKLRKCPKKGAKKIFNFKLAFNYACLHDGATTPKISLFVKII